MNSGTRRYIEATDCEGGPEVPIAGAINFDKFLLRNASPLTSNFYGQLQSTCICPTCNSVSCSFQPYNTIPLSFPSDDAKNIYTIFVGRVPAGETLGRSLAVTVSVKKAGTLADVRAEVSRLTGSNLGALRIAEVYKSNFFDYFGTGDQDPVHKVDKDDVLVCYEVNRPKGGKEEGGEKDDEEEEGEEEEDAYPIETFVTLSDPGGRNVGLPLITCIKGSSTLNDVRKQLWTLFRRSFGPSSLFREGHPFHGLSESYITVMGARAIDVYALSSMEALKGNNWKRGRPLPFEDKVVDTIFSSFVDEKIRPGPVKYSFLNVRLPSALWDLFDEDESRKLENHSSYLAAQESEGKKSKKGGMLTLDSMLKTFLKPEILDSDNSKYCSKCKEHKRQMKTVTIRKLPNILIFIFTRHDYRSAYRTLKHNEFVDFPVDGLDMSKHCAAYNESEKGIGGPPSEVPATYDLFGVVQHYGRAGFGHYTSCCRTWSGGEDAGPQGAMEPNFFEFDDGNTSKIKASAKERIVNEQAYCLFYRRRHFT